MILKEGEIFFNNKSSYKDLNLKLTEYPKIPLTYENFDTEKNVYMRKSPLIINNGTYSNKEISFTFTKVSNENLLDFDNIYDWLLNVKDNRFMYSFDNRCLICKKVEFGDFKQEFKSFGTISIKFILAPFWEDIKETDYIINKSNFNFMYYGSIEGEPILKVYGNGNVGVTINNTTMTISNLKDYVIIDCELMKVIDSNMESKDFDTTGNFFELERGNNTLSFTGNVTKIELTFKNKWR